MLLLLHRVYSKGGASCARRVWGARVVRGVRARSHPVLSPPPPSPPHTRARRVYLWRRIQGLRLDPSAYGTLRGGEEGEAAAT